MNKENLTELKWTDIYAPNFKEFRKKYGKIIKGGSGYRLYVNFTNYGGFDNLARGINPNPDHSDPLGVYAYPLRYVVQYPADVWYGSKTKYLRVLEDTTPHNKRLNLSSIRFEREAAEILYKMGMSDCYRLLEIAKKLYNKKNIGSALLAVIQLKIEEVPYKKSYKWDMDLRSKVPMRTNAEQTALLKKAGFWTIIDEAKNANTAAINYREPEQICFLVPQAFKVKEVFSLLDVKRNHLSAVNKWSSVEQKKLANTIANLLNDRLSGEYDGYTKFWTQKGRRIEISIVTDHEAASKKGYGIITKKHKGSKLYDFNEIHVTVSCEWGDFQYTIDKDEEIKDGLAYIIYDLINKSKGEKKEGWVPETRKTFEEKTKEVNRAYLRSEEKKVIEGNKNITSTTDDINAIADILSLPGFDAEESVLYRKDISYAINIIAKLIRLQGITENAPNPKVSYDYSYENDTNLWYPTLREILTQSFNKIDMDNFTYYSPFDGDTMFSRGAWFTHGLVKSLKEL